MRPTAQPRTGECPWSSDRPDGGAQRRAPGGLFEPAQLVQSFPEALRKLHPRALVKNPVLFVVSVGAVLTTLSAALHPDVSTWVISASVLPSCAVTRRMPSPSRAIFTVTG